MAAGGWCPGSCGVCVVAHWRGLGCRAAQGGATPIRRVHPNARPTGPASSTHSCCRLATRRARRRRAAAPTPAASTSAWRRATSSSSGRRSRGPSASRRRARPPRAPAAAGCEPLHIGSARHTPRHTPHFAFSRTVSVSWVLDRAVCSCLATMPPYDFVALCRGGAPEPRSAHRAAGMHPAPCAFSPPQRTHRRLTCSLLLPAA